MAEGAIVGRKFRFGRYEKRNARQNVVRCAGYSQSQINQRTNSIDTDRNLDTDRNPVGWFEIYVQDMDRAKALYEKNFDVKLERLESGGGTMGIP